MSGTTVGGLEESSEGLLGSLAADLVVERHRVHENDELPLAVLAVEGECQVGGERSVVAPEVRAAAK